MILNLADSHRLDLLRHHSGEPFLYSHAQIAYALAAKSDRSGQHEVRAIWFQQISRADIGMKAFGDKSYNVHQRLGGLAPLRYEIRNLFERQDVVNLVGTQSLFHIPSDF